MQSRKIISLLLRHPSNWDDLQCIRSKFNPLLQWRPRTRINGLRLSGWRL